MHRGAGGETVLSLISDDNFNHFLQRTVFLQFTLHDDGARAAPSLVENVRWPRATATIRIRHELQARRSRHGRASARGDLRARVRPRHHLRALRGQAAGRLRAGRHGTACGSRRTRERIVGSIAIVDAGEGRRPAALVPARAGGARHRARQAPARGGARLWPRARLLPRLPVELRRPRGRAAALRARGLQGHRDEDGPRSGAPSAPRCAWTWSLA